MNLQTYRERIRRILTKRRKQLLVFSFVFGMLIHFSVYCNRIGNPDTVDVELVHLAGKWEISLGRWLIPLFDYFRGGLSSAVLVTMLCIGVMAAGSVLLIEVLKIHDTICAYIAAAAFMASPAFAVLLTYYYCSDSYAVAVLLQILGVYFICRNGNRNFLTGVTMLVLSMGIYQAYIGVAAGLFCALLLREALEQSGWKELSRKIGRYLMAGILTFLLYFIITKIIWLCTGIQQNTYSGGTEVGIDSILRLPESIPRTYKYFWEYIFGYRLNNAYWHRNQLWSALIVIELCLLIIIIIKNKIYLNRGAIIVLTFSILLMPLLINLIGLLVPARGISLLMAIPMGLILPISISVLEVINRSFVKADFIKVICFLLSVLIIASNIFMNEATYMARKLTENTICTLAGRMLDRAESMSTDDEKIEVMIIGDINSNQNYLRENPIYDMADDYISNWGLTWSDYNGTKTCWNSIYRTFFGMDLNQYTDQEYLDIVNSEAFAEMGIYPAQSSVARINDYIVIKLSDEPPLP